MDSACPLPFLCFSICGLLRVARESHTLVLIDYITNQKFLISDISNTRWSFLLFPGQLLPDRNEINTHLSSPQLCLTDGIAFFFFFCPGKSKNLLDVRFFVFPAFWAYLPYPLLPSSPFKKKTSRLTSGSILKFHFLPDLSVHYPLRSLISSFFFPCIFLIAPTYAQSLS